MIHIHTYIYYTLFKNNTESKCLNVDSKLYEIDYECEKNIYRLVVTLNPASVRFFVWQPGTFRLFKEILGNIKVLFA